jgi:uncharacterized protein YgbK (DUF1537 family)
MLFVEILALADDLTGAVEVGAQFAGRGIASRVTTDVSFRAAELVRALVIDTETRHVPPREAEERVYALARASQSYGVGLLYKKTDSTLRGNIGIELAALAAAFPGCRVRYAPAYPRLGRTVRGGRLYVHGRPVEETAFARDPLDPVRDGCISRVLGAEGGVVDVYDGETEDDIARVAEAVMEAPPPRLAAGPAALAEAIAERVPGAKSGSPVWPVIRRCLVVNGSRHEASLEQVRYAEAHGCTGKAGWVVRRQPGSAGESRLQYAARLGEAVRAQLTEEPFDALAVIGGDTAFAILRALGCTALEPLGEVMPGVPVSRMAGHDLYLISKAGGFGGPDVLCLLRDRLS